MRKCKSFFIMLSKEYQFSIPTKFFHKSGGDATDDILESPEQEMIDVFNQATRMKGDNRDVLE